MPTIEERLAALEKQMAAWIDQQPTNYYTHQYSGEEIDNAVGRALTGGALDTSVTNVSNQLGTFVRPNLLDNWYFGRPVNQRGQTEYSNVGYTIDRWKHVFDGTSTLSIVDGAVQIKSNSETYDNFDMAFEMLPANLTFTLSFLVDNADNVSQIYVADVSSQFESANKNMFVLTFMSSSGVKNKSVGIQAKNGATLNILAAKLELGPTQTLAHREGDKWVLNEVPEYGEQLRRCQRYAIDLHGPTNYGVLGSGVARRTDRASIFCPLPVSMRVTPVATFGGSLTLASDADAGRGYVVTAVNVDHINSNGITLNVDTAGLTISTVYQLWRQGDASAHILLSADL